MCQRYSTFSIFRRNSHTMCSERRWEKIMSFTLGVDGGDWRNFLSFSLTRKMSLFASLDPCGYRLPFIFIYFSFLSPSSSLLSHSSDPHFPITLFLFPWVRWIMEPGGADCLEGKVSPWRSRRPVWPTESPVLVWSGCNGSTGGSGHSVGRRTRRQIVSGFGCLTPSHPRVLGSIPQCLQPNT